jgi:hypothetical protein
MKLSVAIMAHPTRKAFVDELLPQLPGAVVVWDERNDRWHTGRRSMLAFSARADWHLVVQDDALLCKDFLGQVREALAEVADGPAAFYCGRSGQFGSSSSFDALNNAFRKGERWVKAPGPFWGPAVAVRTVDIPAMVRWCDRRPDIPNYDRRMSRYFHHLKRDCWYSVPCLVEHRVGAENPSLVVGRGNSRGRTAALWFPLGRDEWRSIARANRREGKGLGLSFAITAHPSRSDYLPHLLERIPDASVIVDDGRGNWATTRRAWEHHDPEADHHVIIQDDAVLCRDFVERAHDALTDAHAAYSLYLGQELQAMRRRAAGQYAKGTHTVELDRLYWGVAISLPVEHIAPMLKWTAGYKVPKHWEGRRSDGRVGKYLEHHSVPILYPLPSLVDHRVGPSLFGKYAMAPTQRVAWWWADGDVPKEIRRVLEDRKEE